MTYRVEDNDDLEVSGRILEVFRVLDPTGEREGFWDGAIEYIFSGEIEAPPGG